MKCPDSSGHFFCLINNYMPGVARVLGDNAGGTQLGPGAPSVKTEGFTTAVMGDRIAPHGDPPHVTPVMVQASGTVFAEGIQVCRQSDAASCNHTSTGSGTVFAG
jgi:uncharacterized Zn-binding protein involved in type VI secretion